MIVVLYFSCNFDVVVRRDEPMSAYVAILPGSPVPHFLSSHLYFTTRLQGFLIKCNCGNSEIHISAYFM